MTKEMGHGQNSTQYSLRRNRALHPNRVFIIPLIGYYFIAYVLINQFVNHYFYVNKELKDIHMNRTVPSATSAEIQLYRTTLYSLLRSSAEIKIRTLEQVHEGMNSSMHLGALETTPDISAFIYSTMRLPDCISQVRFVILGQNADVFRQNGILNVENWQLVTSRARRRRSYFNGEDTLACFIASRSDIEDVVPVLTAYQIEWNKIHGLLRRWPANIDLSDIDINPKYWSMLSEITQIPSDDLERLKTIWREAFFSNMKLIQQKEISFNLRLLGGSLAQYMKATHEWFENIKTAFPEILERPLYFVSSNPHSLANVLTGFALQHESELIDYIENTNEISLKSEWKKIKSGQVRSNRENYLYYILKKYQNTPAGFATIDKQFEDERKHGIIRVQSEHTFDVEAQVIELSKLDFSNLDGRLSSNEDISCLRKSDAVILNIDYPLGLAMYNILSTVSIHTNLSGIYIMGKSASLNATQGDVIIPTVCQDEHSRNTFFVQNCFSASDVSSYLKFGTVLDNQKAITVLGTFLQNVHIMDVFFSEGFADIEMEFGNACSAIYEATHPKRYPNDEIVNLQDTGLDFGVLHYVSDAPLNKGKNLGAGTLSYFGMDSTYACSIAIVRRIMQLECQRLSQNKL
ncbi:MAG: hypothetical protein P4L50_27730 [Anaerolineaceae bacterium]|nr:hypothetical protein [Anaerolineaceae bacterium]